MAPEAGVALTAAMEQMRDAPATAPAARRDAPPQQWADADEWLAAGMRQAGLSFYFDRKDIWKIFTIQTQLNLWHSGERFQT
jgi:hypothetical protein